MSSSLRESEIRPVLNPTATVKREQRGTKPNRPLHVLLVSNTRARMGGADRDWVTLANALGPSEVRISWVGADETSCLSPYLDPSVVTRILDLEFPLFTYLAHENARERRSPWLWTKIVVDQLLKLREPVRELQRLLARDPVDIVVSATTVVMLGARYAQACGLPHVWCVKEYLDPNVLACRRFANLISRLSSAVIVPSSAVGSAFAGSVRIFPDGSDVAGIRFGARRASRKEVLKHWGLPDAQLVVAQVGALQRWKGQHLTAEAFVRLSKSGDVPPFSLVFLGDGASVYKERLKQILAEAPDEWRSAVRFLSFSPDDLSFVEASDIVVHPSVLPDPYPNAVREAMILGKPVIAARAGGLPDMIRHAESGLLIDPCDADDLAASIGRLINSPGERARLGGAAQRFAMDHFDIKTCKEPLADLLRCLVDARTPQRETT